MELGHIGFAVRTARQAANMSAKELASAVDITPTTLSKIETGRQNLDFKMAMDIAKALNIDLTSLAILAEKVAASGIESNNVRAALASRLKQLEKEAVETALSIMHEKEPEKEPEKETK